MRLLQLSLNAKDQATVRSTVAFLEGRLEKKETIEWALSLGPDNILKRRAILHLLNTSEGISLREPWRSAWRLIEEFWDAPDAPVSDFYGRLSIYNVQDRLRSGERSGALVSAIVNLVAPRLSIEAYEKWQLQFRKFPKRPKKFHDLFQASLTSEKIVDPASLGLQEVTEGEFLVSLANALDAAIIRGLDIARRIGWRELYLFINRVYYVSESERGEETDEPDKYRKGIAPSVKLLHSVVALLVDIDCFTALDFITRWKRKDSPIHLRLWAAMSRDPRITTAAEVGDFILHLDYKVFWDVQHHPEIAELRTRRFSELDDATQRAIIRRIRKGPPRNSWPKNAEANQIEEARLYWVLRELKRIEVAGATLPPRDKSWLESNIVRFSELAEMNRIDEGFLESPQVQDVLTKKTDHSIDSLEGIDRLRALEQKLSAPRRGWDDDPAGQAWNWLRGEGNSVRILRDMESSPDGGAEFPMVWEDFGQVHSPSEDQGQDPHARDLSAETGWVLALLAKLPSETLSEAIGGISHWLSRWEEYVVSMPNWSAIWLRAWPLAVETTNAVQPPSEEPNLNVVMQPGPDEPHDLDTLNSPAGKLVGVFLAACRKLEENPRPFDSPSDLGKVRDHVINASGLSGLIAKHRMIEGLRYFLYVDEEWTKEHLIRPLRADDAGALALWRAVGRRTQFTDVLKIIGNDMVDRTTDSQLGRETRRSLTFSLVIESLHALREGREPAVKQDRVQQMIRSLDDEVRAECAEAITRFVEDLSEASAQEPDPLSPKHLFQSAAKPFLRDVWPQERSLTSPGISDRLSRLPAITRGEFAKAVKAIERFLVPFECWSMDEYGLYGDDDGTPKLSIIDNEAKARALLCLLDRTIGTAENAVIPYDLGDALEQVRKVAPNLARNPEYRRLETAARRV